MGAVVAVGYGMKKRTRTEFFENEHAFQKYYIKRLRELGFTVRTTSTPNRGRKQLRSIADVLVRHPCWGKGIWKALESKSLTGDFSSGDQHEAFLNGEFEVVRTWDEVCRVVGVETK